MAIDLAREEIRSLAQLAATLPGRGDKRVNASTVYRGCARGIRAKDGTRVKLEHVRLGSRIVSSIEALQRFGELLASEPDAAPVIERRTPTQRERACAKANEQLEAMGL